MRFEVGVVLLLRQREAGAMVGRDGSTDRDSRDDPRRERDEQPTDEAAVRAEREPARGGRAGGNAGANRDAQGAGKG